jgi:hypothetical protein
VNFMSLIRKGQIFMRTQKVGPFPKDIQFDKLRGATFVVEYVGHDHVRMAVLCGVIGYAEGFSLTVYSDLVDTDYFSPVQ